MTRFARAKGSKSSNERKEEEPTPWHVMRQQLADQISNNNSQTKVNISYDLKSILKDDNESNKEEIWTDFGNNKRISSKPSKKNKKQSLEKNKLHKEKKKVNVEQRNVGDFSNKTNNNNIGKGSMNIKTPATEILMGNLVDKESENAQFDEDSYGNADLCVKETELNTNKKIKRNKKHKTADNKNKRENQHLNDNIDSEPPTKKSKKTENSTISNSHLTSEIEQSVLDINRGSNVKKKNKMLVNEPRSEQMSNKPINSDYKCNKTQNNNFSNWKKYDKPHTIIANGREIKVIEFEGFLVKKEDSDELKKLRKKLRAQNISKEKIKVIIQLERRKAEKSLAREKTNVCFHCRKFGHKLSDCPDIKDTELSKSGICFKCGSMEHSHRQCRVLKSQDFRYAVCFVCKEQGHIARQCPLNPQGQYPKGGSCHLCGEVTHLRKDCPKANESNSSNKNTFTVEQLNNNQLEDIIKVDPQKEKLTTKRTRVVKF